MIILAIIITWYISKLYYTRDPFVHVPGLHEHGYMTAQCSGCSQYIVITHEELRNPFYCMRCK